MKILLVQDTDWIKRNPMQHNHLAERLVKKGHEFKVIDYEILWRADENAGLLSKRQVISVSRILKNANIEIIRPPIVRIPLLDYFSMLFTYREELRRQIDDYKPDIVIGDGILTPFLAFKAAKDKGVPVVYYAIDVDYKLIPLKFLHPLGKFIESKNIRRADKVISINEGLRDYTIRMGAKADNTLVLRAGIDTKHYNSDISGAEFRNKYGINKNDKVLFFMGWMYHFSGLKEVALELSKINDDSIKLVIVGDGDAYNDLQQICKKYNLQNRCILTGKRPYEEIPWLIAAADICILPAYNNAIMRDIVPIKMYEYMAMRKPVIATKLPGVMKEFGNNNGVAYVEKPEAVVAKAVELFQGGLIKELGIKARNFVEQYTWESITDEFEKTLALTMEGKNRRGV
jgi:glycosyltransferase involved in cell wall biosynthesis